MYHLNPKLWSTKVSEGCSPSHPYEPQEHHGPSFIWQLLL
jgi:hypothetical protein